MTELNKVKKHLKKGKASGRDNFPAEIVIEGGENLDRLILNTMSDIKSADMQPTQWEEVKIATMYKNKGNKKRLINQIMLPRTLAGLFYVVFVSE